MTKFPVLPLAPSRNILIALSSGQGIQPWLMGLTKVAYGSWPCQNGLERGRFWEPGAEVAWAAIAAISGLIPTMFITRVRL